MYSCMKEKKGSRGMGRQAPMKVKPMKVHLLCLLPRHLTNCLYRRRVKGLESLHRNLYQSLYRSLYRVLLLPISDSTNVL